MFIREIKTSVLDLALILSEYQDLVWLDSASNGGNFSLLAFNASEEKIFTDFSQGKDFLGFLDTAFCSPFKIEPSAFEAFTAPLWLGYIAYEAYAFNPAIPLKPRFLPPYPLAVFRRYKNYFFTDHKKQKTVFISHDAHAEELLGNVEKKVTRLSGLINQKPTENLWTLGRPVWNRGADNYASDFFKIKNSLAQGDFLELNYTLEFLAPFSGNSFSAYLALRKTAPAPFMAYFGWPEVKILSASPECFFKIEGRKIQAFPIKGTRKCFGDVAIDEKIKTALLTSEKDRAELLMVTDLLRNDLGRICEIGSVSVDKLFSLNSFSHYHHLISTLSGHLEKTKNLSDVFLSLFPGGSITGAPKIEVMKHIDKLENRARGIYTGALGLVTEGFCEFSIPIRTAFIHKVTSPPARELKCAVGSGIVSDSECEAEYDECLLKASGLLQALRKSS